jgi:hypothetical protein
MRTVPYDVERQIEPVGRLLAALELTADQLSRHAVYRDELSGANGDRAVFTADVASIANSLSGLALALATGATPVEAAQLGAITRAVADLRDTAEPDDRAGLGPGGGSPPRQPAEAP